MAKEVTEKGWAKEKQSPPSSKAQSLSRASNKGKENQKIVKNERQTVQTNHGKCMSSRQILDICGRKARVRPRLHQSVPSQYRTRWDHGSEVRGHGLVVGRGEKPILRFLVGLFWEKYPVEMAYHPKEAKLS